LSGALACGVARRNFLKHIAHQTMSALQVSRELLDELLEAGSALRSRRVLMRFRDRNGHGELVPNKKRHRLDQDGLIPFESIELMRKLPKSPSGQRFASIRALG
jgi:hypothetical protein